MWLLTIAIRSSCSCSLLSLSIDNNHKCCHFLDKWETAGWWFDPDRVNEGVRSFSGVYDSLSRDRSRDAGDAGEPDARGILLPVPGRRVGVLTSGVLDDEWRRFIDFVSRSYFGCFLAISSWKIYEINVNIFSESEIWNGFHGFHGHKDFELKCL